MTQHISKSFSVMIQVVFGKSHISYLRFSSQNLFAIKLLFFGSGTRDPLSGIRDQGSKKFQVGPKTRDVNQ